jgi:hypothetical protein
MAQPEWVAENAQASIGRKRITRLELDFLQKASEQFPDRLVSRTAFLEHWRSRAEA